MQVHGTLIDERKKLSQFTNSIHTLQINIQQLNLKCISNIYI